MTAEPSQVIVVAEEYPSSSSSATRVHHRHFAEIEAEGASVLEATERLLQLLAGVLDDIPDDWHRSSVEQAITDVREFLKTSTD